MHSTCGSPRVVCCEGFCGPGSSSPLPTHLLSHASLCSPCARSKLLQDEATITVTSTAPAVTSLYQILEGVEDLSVLKSLVDFAGPDFVGLLNSTDTAYTVFAPTNKAFEKLLAQAGAEAASNQTLVQAILATHVVFNATLTAEDAAAADGQSVESLVEGVSLTVHVDTSGIYIASPGNAAKVVDTDIVGGKGIAHVIDAVLL